MLYLVLYTPRNICFGYSLKSPHWDDCNKYPKHMFCEEIRIKTMPFLHIILYNSKFISVTTSVGTNAVVIFVCVKVLRPKQPYGVMSSAVSLPNHTFCLFDLGLTSLSTIFQSYRSGVWMWQGAHCSLLECCLTEISRPRHFDMIFHPVTLY